MPTLHKPVFATPKAGLNIRKEDGKYLPEGGDTVIHSSYWVRREQDGDVTLSDDLPKEDLPKEDLPAAASPADAAGKPKATK